MAWSNPFKADDENTRNVFGYKFQWTPEHQTAEQLKPLKYSYDVLGEECLNRLDKISPPATGEIPRSQSRVASKEKADPPPKRDLYALLRDHHHEDEKLGELWSQINDTPEWVDWDQIGRGQEVFYRYGGAALTAVCLSQSLYLVYY
jgi:hypothetical protein